MTSTVSEPPQASSQGITLSTSPTTSGPTISANSVVQATDAAGHATIQAGPHNNAISKQSPNWVRLWRCTKSFIHRLGKLIVGMSAVLATLYAIWTFYSYSRRQDELSRWTSQKDFLEHCASLNFTSPGCSDLRDVSLDDPPFLGEMNWLARPTASTGSGYGSTSLHVFRAYDSWDALWDGLGYKLTVAFEGEHPYAGVTTNLEDMYAMCDVMLEMPASAGASFLFCFKDDPGRQWFQAHLRAGGGFAEAWPIADVHTLDDEDADRLRAGWRGYVDVTHAEYSCSW